MSTQRRITNGSLPPVRPRRGPPVILVLALASAAGAVVLGLLLVLRTRPAEAPLPVALDEPAAPSPRAQSTPVRLARPTVENRPELDTPAPRGSLTAAQENARRLQEQERDEAQRRGARIAFARAARLDPMRTSSFDAAVHQFVSTMAQLVDQLPPAGDGRAPATPSPEVSTAIEDAYRRAAEEFEGVGLNAAMVTEAMRMLPQQLPAAIRPRLVPLTKKVFAEE